MQEEIYIYLLGNHKLRNLFLRSDLSDSICKLGSTFTRIGNNIKSSNFKHQQIFQIIWLKFLKQNIFQYLPLFKHLYITGLKLIGKYFYRNKLLMKTNGCTNVVRSVVMRMLCNTALIMITLWRATGGRKLTGCKTKWGVYKGRQLFRERCPGGTSLRCVKVSWSERKLLRSLRQVQLCWTKQTYDWIGFFSLIWSNLGAKTVSFTRNKLHLRRSDWLVPRTRLTDVRNCKKFLCVWETNGYNDLTECTETTSQNEKLVRDLIFWNRLLQRRLSYVGTGHWKNWWDLLKPAIGRDDAVIMMIEAALKTDNDNRGGWSCLSLELKKKARCMDW